MAIIKVVNLTKKFKDLVAVDDVSLDIEERECFGLLGPNGAGKTSLIRMITAVSPPTTGSIFVLGKDLSKHASEVKARLGVVPQIENFDPDLRVIHNLLTYARYFDIPPKEARRRAMEVLKLFQLEEKQKSQIRELSGGMKHRLLIARGLINQPEILILDEPTIGLDPQAKHLVWQKLRQLKAQGVTELLCTQNMEEATLLCDRVAVMHLGKILALDAPQALIRRYVGSKVWEIEVTPGDKEKVTSDLTALKLKFEEAGHVIEVFHLDDETARKLVSFNLRPRSATLEDVFFRLTGRLLIE
jgi:lipooligosaccharide transport system ATP-binding protein